MKKIIISIAVVLVAGLLALGFIRADQSNVPSQAQSLEGDVMNTPTENPNGESLGGIFENMAGGTIGAGRNQASFRNTYGKPIYVYLADVSTTGTASSSFTLYVATSSTATIADNFTAPFSSIINGFLLATSSVATTTSNYDTPKNSRVVKVNSGQYVVFQLQSTFDCVSNGLCETATSTNRGFNLVWRAKFHD